MKIRNGRRSSSEPRGGSPGPGIPAALKMVVGPMLAGLAIDALDLITFGAIGIYSGLIVGSSVGWWLAPVLGFPPRGRWLCAIMTGVYCTLPLTGFLPAATIAAGLSRVILRDREPDDPRLDPVMRPEGAIDAEYKVVEDEESGPRGDSNSKPS